MGIVANDFTNTPYVPYNIYDYLMNHNENIFKILKYPTVDCLSRPNLTMKEKVALLWKGSADETNYNVFFKPLVGDELISETTQMRINKVYSQEWDQIQSPTLILSHPDLLSVGPYNHNHQPPLRFEQESLPSAIHRFRDW